ncbi:MAG: tautomerase [Thermodesulfobacteriota bacterium]|nr:MAG: tautomerase [Thermodesulfobacteriota bacterium]
MPYINLQITKGASREQKKTIVEQMTNTLVDVLGKKPEHIHIVIDEVDEDNWGFNGMLTSDYRGE